MFCSFHLKHIINTNILFSSSLYAMTPLLKQQQDQNKGSNNNNKQKSLKKKMAFFQDI